MNGRERCAAEAVGRQRRTLRRADTHERRDVAINQPTNEPVADREEPQARPAVTTGKRLRRQTPGGSLTLSTRVCVPGTEELGQTEQAVVVGREDEAGAGDTRGGQRGQRQVLVQVVGVDDIRLQLVDQLCNLSHQPGME